MGDDGIAAELAEAPATVLAACACTSLRRAARLVTHRYDATLASSGLRLSQFTLLLACAVEEAATIGAIADRLDLDRTTLTRTLRRLSESDHVEIVRGADRRARRVSLTDHGRATLKRALPLWAAAERDLAAALGWDDLEGLMTSLRRLSAGGPGSG